MVLVCTMLRVELMLSLFYVVCFKDLEKKLFQLRLFNFKQTHDDYMYGQKSKFQLKS